ncbi:MAG: small ribosomal subunit Rsm22 family protein [Rectinema subterraneum]|uniref:small ribosomal subunit Rsm22 family protein n=1 Tax=Rectinema subterraneum TaxID=2653714 RepID=UPI003C79C85D
MAKRLFDAAMARHAAEWYGISKAEGLALGNKGQVQKIAENLRALQRGLTGDRARVASGYMDEKSALQAYLLYYWPVSFYETAAVLAELAERRTLPNIQTVLDLGSGPGPGSFAASLFGAERAVLVDASQAALDVASRIAEEGRQGGSSMELSTLAKDLQDFSVGILSRFSSSSIELSAGFSADRALLEPPFDLIIASHSINELWHDEPERIERRRNMLLSLLPVLREGGLLLIIEPSAHYTSIPLLALRDSLLEAAGSFTGGNFAVSDEARATLAVAPAAAHLFCVGPCPHSGPCPMRAIGDRPCFSEWKWDAPTLVRQLAEMAGLDRTSLKASWVAFQKTGEKLGADFAEHAANSAAPPPADEPAISGRIVSEPMLNKAGRIRYIVCTENGQLSTISAPQNDPAAIRAGTGALDFFNLARGDLIEASGLEERGRSHFGIIPDSSLRIKMKAPRF